jgi:hypothetical protein
MNLVFRANGLNTGEFAFLIACCNHTDDRGYVIASMQQLADEAHMKMTAAKSNKQRLIKRGLLASRERYSPKNGARISDLYRVNLKLLAEMKRQRVDYGPSLVEELSFGASEETTSSDPRSDSDPTPGRNPTPPRRNPTPPPAKSDGDAGSESDPLLLPSSSPSSLSGAEADSESSPSTEPDAGERESATPKEHPDARQVLAAYEQALGGPALNGTRAQLLKDASDLLAVRPLPWVIDRAKELPRFGKSLARHAEMSRVPFARAEKKPVEGMCVRHPGFREDDCSPCRKAEMERAQREPSDLAPVDGAALLASLLQKTAH